MIIMKDTLKTDRTTVIDKADEIRELLIGFNEDRFNGELTIKLNRGDISLVECTAKGQSAGQINEIRDHMYKFEEINKVLDNKS